VLQKCHAKKGLQYFESYAIISPVATNRANSWRFDLKEKALSLEWRKGFFYGE